MNERDVIDYFQAFLAPAVALLAVVIAILQWRINRAKLRHELFDKRFYVFDSVRTFISKTLGNGSPTQEDQLKYLEATAGSRFLFSPVVADYLKEIWDKACDLECAVSECKDLGKGDERSRLIRVQRELKNWFYAEAKNIDVRFESYLAIESSGFFACRDRAMVPKAAIDGGKKLAFNFKREFGISEVIALAALVLSIVALWQSSKADDPYSLVGSGPIMVGLLERSGSNGCEFVAQIPIEINNSGNRSVVFERLVQDGDTPPLLLSVGETPLAYGDVPYEIYLTDFAMRSPSEWPVAAQSALELDIAAAKYIGTVIRSKQSFSRFVVIRFPVMGVSKRIPDTLLFALKVELSDGKPQEFRSSFELPKISAGCADS